VFFPLNGLQTLCQQALADMLDPRHILPPRRLRANPRVVKRKMSKFGVKREEHRLWPQPTRSPEAAVRIRA
jgi:hypothetical protein